jgi:hypothetical protein
VKHLVRGPARRRLAWGLVPLAAVAAAVLTTFAGGAIAQEPNANAGLSKEDRALVAAADLNGVDKVQLVVATAPGNTKAVAAEMTRYGATPVKAFDRIGYLVVEVAPQLAVKAAKAAGIRAVDVDRAVSISGDGDGNSGENSRRTGDRGEGRWGWTRHGSDAGDPTKAGAVNPFMPTYSIGATQFRQRYPSYDGRGITVGIVDTGVDVDRPELQTARDATGKTVPKIVDWVTTTIPRATSASNRDRTWLPMTLTLDASYTLPNVPGAVWRLGQFVEGPLLGGELGSDINRDGDTNDTFFVLLDKTSKTVWVDTNQNKNFADEKAMQDYYKHHDINHFGKDNPATPEVVETLPFTVQTERYSEFNDSINGGTSFHGIPDWVNIGIVSGGHGTHVAGTVAGKGFFGGHFDGVAPNAQLAVARVCLFVTGCFTSDQIDAFIHLAYDDKVDLIQMSIGGLGALNDGEDAVAQIISAISDDTNVQFFFSQGNNGPGANTAGSPGDGFSVVGSGAYQSKETWLANYNGVVQKRDTLWIFSSRGPLENGGLKPDVIAPGSELSTWPSWNLSQDPFHGGVGARPYQLPPGYEMIQGTSMASPMTAGAAALLLSAAKQTNLTVSPQQLKNALMSTGRVIKNYGMYEQGTGLVQVDDAWKVLRSGIAIQKLSSEAEANTVLAKALGIKGKGIYIREGWSAGQTAVKNITIKRGDSVGSGNYKLRWVTTDGRDTQGGKHDWRGNNRDDDRDGGAFSSAGRISIAPNGSAVLPVRISTPKSGIYSSILQVDDPTSPGIEYQILNTVVASQPFKAPSYAITNSAKPDRADGESFFIRVDPNVSVLTVNMHVNSGRVKLDVIDPFGVPYVLPAPCNCSLDFLTGPGDSTLSIPTPMAGVWEVNIEGSRRNPTDVPGDPDASFTATEYAVGIAPSPWNVTGTTAGQTYTQQLTFTNKLAAFTGAATGSAFGSAQEATPTATDPAAATDPSQVTQEFEIDVPSGATNLHVEIGNPSDPGADLDLYLFYCGPTGAGPCVLRAQSAGSSAHEVVNIVNPDAGVWVSSIDDFAVPSGTSTYDYSDVIAAPVFGSVTVADTSASHANGAVWTATGSAKPLQAPTAGRFLQGLVQVKTSAGDLVGSSKVNLRP